jgi:hypothetical protein
MIGIIIAMKAAAGFQSEVIVVRGVAELDWTGLGIRYINTPVYSSASILSCSLHAAYLACISKIFEKRRKCSCT